MRGYQITKSNLRGIHLNTYNEKSTSTHITRNPPLKKGNSLPVLPTEATTSMCISPDLPVLPTEANTQYAHHSNTPGRGHPYTPNAIPANSHHKTHTKSSISTLS